MHARLAEPDFLDRAFCRTVRGKRHRADVAWLIYRKETFLADLLERLRSGTWRPAPFHTFLVRDPKPRWIARAPIEDRVVHTALVDSVEPVFARSWTDDDFACREGRGAHRARLRLLEHTRRFRWFVHLDVRAYFPSIDLEVVRELFARRVRDERVRALMDLVLDSGKGLYDAPAVRRLCGLGPEWPPPGRGLPIGALTSQFLAAHVVLNELDHRVRRVLHVPGYVRYVDDLLLFGWRRADLYAWRDDVADWIWGERGLRLKAPMARVRSTSGALDALGARIIRSSGTAYSAAGGA